MMGNDCDAVGAQKCLIKKLLHISKANRCFRYVNLKYYLTDDGNEIKFFKIYFTVQFIYFTCREQYASSEIKRFRNLIKPYNLQGEKLLVILNQSF